MERQPVLRKGVVVRKRSGARNVFLEERRKVGSGNLIDGFENVRVRVSPAVQVVTGFRAFVEFPVHQPHHIFKRLLTVRGGADFKIEQHSQQDSLVVVGDGGVSKVRFLHLR